MRIRSAIPRINVLYVETSMSRKCPPTSHPSNWVTWFDSSNHVSTSIIATTLIIACIIHQNIGDFPPTCKCTIFGVFSLEETSFHMIFKDEYIAFYFKRLRIKLNVTISSTLHLHTSHTLYPPHNTLSNVNFPNPAHPNNTHACSKYLFVLVKSGVQCNLDNSFFEGLNKIVDKLNSLLCFLIISIYLYGYEYKILLLSANPWKMKYWCI